ncbi:hypothetical protein GNI_105950 [Gregarina niphandrodes]|uniref:Uncharacterized protein n=1 Tax=Gregarina niphandrodes TaxID=110365 RepID=A0A023B405_GRENI|nr:hypothetical protein GNI_105950 [Gregarina niphandrodes]EZG56070.1 hypothetical protein GNI_105950 [Gregarina niphandrodes]|eukprot:XP_011131359.1 hypothetical protein GNI_105950 [Gregarina niphandrodes]
MNHGGRTPPNESELREVTTLTAQRRSILAAIKQIEESSS